MTCLAYPYTIQELTEEEKELIGTYGRYDLVRIMPIRCLATKHVAKYGPELYNFKPRPDDIWLIGYPRSGTTLVQEILYLLGTDLDYEKAASKIMNERFPQLEEVLMRSNEQEALYEDLCKMKREAVTPEEKACIPCYKKLLKSNERRFIKTHLGFEPLHPQLLEIGCKVIFIARNPKDCIVSSFFYPTNLDVKVKHGIYKMWKVYQNDLSSFGSHLELLKEAWERRHSKNLLILFYEDLITDKRSNIKKISNFLGKKLTDQELETLLDHVDIKKFKQNKSLNNDHLVDSGMFVKNEKYSFIRQGKAGGWREIFSREMNDEINEWFSERIKKDIPGFQIPECWKEAMEL